jgi:multimeric flavodoxin WrbA
VPGKRNNRTIALRVIGISGSPRRSGNTDSLLDKALEGALSEGAFVEKIFLNDLAFKPCQACGRCHRTGVCGIRRDDMGGIYEKIERSDAVIVASPIYFGTVTAQLKAMIDRFHGVWVAKNVLKLRRGDKKRRKGYFLSAAGAAEKKYFVDARKVIRNFFATADIDYSGELFCGGLDAKSSVINDEKAMTKAFSLGKASVKVA